MEELRSCPNSGLVYSLIAAEADGHRLYDDEVIIANTITTLIGGHEATTNLIASGFRTLLIKSRISSTAA
jgi:cytochrome P450